MAEKFTIEDVPAWMTYRGIGHIIAGQGIGSGWAQWACGVQTPYGNSDIEKAIPKRICRKCRSVLDEYRQEYMKRQKR